MARYQVLRDAAVPMRKFRKGKPVDEPVFARLQQVLDVEHEDEAEGTLVRMGYSVGPDGPRPTVSRTHLTMPLNTLPAFLANAVREGVIPVEVARAIITEMVKALAPLPGEPKPGWEGVQP